MHWKYELLQIGFEIAEYSSLKIFEWFLVEYPCQGGFSEGGRRLTLSWLHDRSRPKRSCFVPYFQHRLENEVFK